MIKMKGISSLVIGIILVLLVLTLASGFFLWSYESTEEVTTAVENRTEEVITARGATFEIVNVSFDRTDYTKYPNVTIRNNGKADLNVLELTIYLNGTKHIIEPWGSETILRPGETIVMKIKHG